jgi:hypothetical protein
MIRLITIIKEIMVWLSGRTNPLMEKRLVMFYIYCKYEIYIKSYWKFGQKFQLESRIYSIKTLSFFKDLIYRKIFSKKCYIF